jgi:hypothetical protein
VAAEDAIVAAALEKRYGQVQALAGRSAGAGADAGTRRRGDTVKRRRR